LDNLTRIQIFQDNFPNICLSKQLNLPSPGKSWPIVICK
jgi:hypothetical protein